jgi:hypothetical protein
MFLYLFPSLLLGHKQKIVFHLRPSMLKNH